MTLLENFNRVVENDIKNFFKRRYSEGLDFFGGWVVILKVSKS